jgi:uncharacterized membrane protein
MWHIHVDIGLRMKVDNRVLLILVCCLTLFLFPVTAFSSGLLRIALGFLCLLFFPGYALISALFPKQDTLNLIERVALGFGLSIAIVPLIGLALNYTPWGITLNPILIAVGSFIFVTSLIGIIRQQMMSGDQRFGITLDWDWSAVREMNRMSKILLALVFVATLALAGLVTYSVVKPSPSPKPSEFYLLNSAGKAENYPRQVKPGSPVNIMVSVINNEVAPTAYRVKITCAGDAIKEISTGKLSQGEKWAQTVGFTLQSAGQNRKVDLQLYKEGAAEPYYKDPLYLYLDVTD